MPSNKYKHILIFGPVAPDQIATRLAIPNDWSIQFVNHAPVPPGTNFYENGSAAFAYLVGKIGGDIFEHYAPGSGRIVLGSFSAGHGALEWIFNQLGGDKRIAGVCCADSYYVDDAALKSKTVKPGYLRQAQNAVAGGPPFLMMSSTTGGPGYASSSAATKLLADKLGATTTDSEIPKTYGAGNFVWTDQGDQWTHKEHALIGLPEMLNHAVRFEDARTTPAPAPGPSTASDSSMMTLGLVGLAAYFALGGKR